MLRKYKIDWERFSFTADKTLEIRAIKYLTDFYY